MKISGVETGFDNFNLIKTVILRFLPESTIILFGSRARGDHQNDSDFDLLVVSKSKVDLQHRMNIQSLIRKSLAKYHIPVDVIIYSSSEVDVMRNFPGHVVKSAMKEGITI